MTQWKHKEIEGEFTPILKMVVMELREGKLLKKNLVAVNITPNRISIIYDETKD